MTHEHWPNGEHQHGPEHDDTLPPADEFRGDLTAEESDLLPLEGDL